MVVWDRFSVLVAFLGVGLLACSDTAPSPSEDVAPDVAPLSDSVDGANLPDTSPDSHPDAMNADTHEVAGADTHTDSDALADTAPDADSTGSDADGADAALGDSAGDVTPPDTGPQPNFTPNWYLALGGAGHEEIKAVTADSQGNVYVAGIYREALTIGATTFPATEPGENMPDTFVASYDPKGELRWAHAFGGLNADIPFEIEVDGADNVYVAGSHHEDLTIGGTLLKAKGSTDIFIVAYDMKGNQLWAKNWGGPYGEAPRALSVNSKGDIFVTGSYNGTIEVDGLTASTTVDFGGVSEVFVFLLDGSTQEALWITSFSGVGHDVGTAIVADASRNAVVAVSYQYDLKVDEPAGIVFDTGDTTFNVALVRLDHKGAVTWAIPFAAGGPTEILGLDMDDAGSSYFTGVFEGTASFGGTTFTSQEGHDVMAGAVDTDGAHLWSVAHGGASFDQALDLEVSGAGVYITGRFKADLGFGPFMLQSTEESYDVFVARLSTLDGSTVWAKALGGAAEDQANGIGIGGDGGIFVGGHTKGTFLFAGVPYPAVGVPLDGFVLRCSE